MKKKVNYGRDRSVKVINCEDVVSSCALASSLSSSTHGAAQLHIAGSSKVNVPLEESRSGSMERSVTRNCEVPRITTSSKLKIPTISALGQEGRQSSVDTTSLYETEGRKIEDTKMSYDVFVDSTESTCQIKGCTTDLTSINSYFRRNKVCQAHFKAFKVLLDDHEQRFCHQCNRFHMLSEFDEDRRSCKLSLKRQRTHPEATSVLSSGTLVYLPGKSLKSEENSGLVNASACENIERTATNEEPMKEETSHMETVSKTHEEETGHMDGAPTENTQKETHGSMRGLMDPMVMPRNSTETMKAETTMERPVLSSKNSESKKGSHVGSFANVCQVEGCMFDLSATKDYFRRHKVCEGHFKATTVLVKNVEQRFCQQCSRFHVLAEFEEGRKSCKRMLMGHNMRRRKGLMSNLNPKKGRRTRE